MPKKMKRVAGEKLPLPAYGGGVGVGVYGDAKTKKKHLALLQDYQDLQKETDDMRSKLDAAKQRKLRLVAEVRFLRQRYKYLSKLKSLNRPQDLPLNLEKQHNASAKGRISRKREAAQFKLPPLPKPKPRGKMSGKETAMRDIAPTIDLNRRQMLGGRKEISERNFRKRIPGGKEIAVLNSEPVINWNQSQKVHVATDTAFASRAPIFDLNQDTSLSAKETSFRSRAPTFDLNEISTEEEEIQNSREPLKFEGPKVGSTGGGNDEQPNDLKLSVCRNAGEGSSRMGKRKISWQDPVALRV